MGFLHAVPDEWEGSRWDAYIELHGEPPELPDAGPANYMLQALIESGMAYNNGMGLVPLPWAEVQAYAEASRSIDEPWEKSLLKSLSGDYLKGRDRGLKINGRPFWGDENYVWTGKVARK